ncbi:MAG: hypothetical protein IKA50_01965 [Clostridia bacterium]|nr:hypothetical protein [Clostridia bacterium]
MDNAREKLLSVIKATPIAYLSGRIANAEECISSHVLKSIADHLLANGVAFHGTTELVLDYPFGRDGYTPVPKYYCSHCGFGIEVKSRPPLRPDFLQFCPKCGFMFLPQKEVDDVSS